MLNRIISLIAATFIAIQTLTVFAFAETNAGDSYYYLTISDANGNIVQSEIMNARTTYVNGAKYSIPAGGSLTTYQYCPSINFSTGFKISETTPNKSVTVSIYNSACIGGKRSRVKSRTLNTSTTGTVGPDSDTYMVSTDSISTTKPYYNGKITNNSGSTITVAVVVTMD
ncbi:MAG: hypothetical protein E7485_03840 [Ruminococcaceae bacterium]|nr:hypothetical protein [Oscillospiraceae bacterium]